MESPSERARPTMAPTGPKPAVSPPVTANDTIVDIEIPRVFDFDTDSESDDDFDSESVTVLLSEVCLEMFLLLSAAHLSRTSRSSLKSLPVCAMV